LTSVRSLLTLLSLLTIASTSQARTTVDEPEPLRIRLQVTDEPHIVGQGTVLTVGVIGETERPRVNPPRIEGADVWPIGTDVKPLAVSGIGNTVFQENLFLARFRLVPRKAGTLVIPSQRVEADGRVGRTRPTSITVEPPPLAGRPGTFLGGIGAFSIQAEAEPTTLRVGQTLEYRIHLVGPAAWGSTTPPDLSRFDRLSLGFRIAPVRNDLTPEPASRTFSYRIRPTRPGQASLPAILISSFDPKIGQYQTKATPSLPIRVVAVPEFDASTIHDSSPTTTRANRTIVATIILGSIVLAVLGGGVGWWLIRRRMRSLRNEPNLGAASRFAAHTARNLGTPPNDPSATARRITEAFIRYLELGAGRPPGALTPSEAGRGIADLTRSPELGAEAERVLAICDRTLYGDGGEGRVITDAQPNLGEVAQRLFRRLGNS
jgi:hypothetical protein